uniref:Ammonium transporter AmtB-like domain-containing protein n=1 Tax=Plectus sambesii TaxID=2011161 RepID=A0A914V2I2_9BILA
MKSNLTSQPTYTEVTEDDAGWILSNTFLILTMQTGFGMLEAGSVSYKNIANIMVKNCVDVTLGGLVYWVAGYALSFGEPSTPFFGYGNFFVTAATVADTGRQYAHYVFQLSFATAATTIVSGAVAERMQLQAYMLFAIVNTFGYCLPAMWAWHHNGFLGSIGFFDFAGGCVVHGTGGASAFVAAYVLGARYKRFARAGEEAVHYTASSPVTALTGLFMLWWAWLGFNCGSTFGISKDRWKVAAKVAVTTLNGSIAGGIVGLVSSFVVFKGRFNIDYIILSVMGGLVSITANCAIISPAESLIIGAIGAAIALFAIRVIERMEIDDPVGAIPVHFASAGWGTMCVGIFGKNDFDLLKGHNGLLHGGGLYLLQVQAFGWILISLWSALFTAVFFLAMNRAGILRMSLQDELMGADWVEHGVRSESVGNKIEKIIKQMNLPEDEVQDVFKKMIIEATTSNERQSAFFLGGVNEEDAFNMARVLSQTRQGSVITSRLIRRASEMTIKDLPPSRKISLMNGTTPRKESLAVRKESSVRCRPSSTPLIMMKEDHTNGIP